MPLEEEIVVWSKTRPAWQRAILKRIAAGDLPSAEEYATLVEGLVSGKNFDDVAFDLEELPQAAPGDPPVSLLSISKVEHVNALDGTATQVSAVNSRERDCRGLFGWVSAAFTLWSSRRSAIESQSGSREERHSVNEQGDPRPMPP